MRALGRAVVYVWTLPNTIVGLVLAALSFQRPRVERGTIVVDRGRRGFLWALPRMRRSAITFGHVILSTRPLCGRLLAHELHHVRQYERLGPFYLPVYLAVFLVTGYRRHPMELAARRAEGA